MKKALQQKEDYDRLCEMFDHSGFHFTYGYSYAEVIESRKKKRKPKEPKKKII